MTAIYPPNLSYLEKTVTVTLDANGFGIVVLGPDTGQYWLPIIAQCNVKSVGSSVLGKPTKCLLYAGSSGRDPDATFLKDFTNQGSNDTSTILSGTVVPPGIKIIFAFSGGFPGEIASGRIIGLSSVVPPTEGIVPEIPGERFFGSQPAETLNRTIYFRLGQSINATFTDPPIGVGDAKSILVNFTHVGGAGGGPMQVQLKWYNDGALTEFLTTDLIDFNGVFGQQTQQTYPCKGRYLVVTVVPTGAVPVAFNLVITLQYGDFKANLFNNLMYVLSANPVVVVPGSISFTAPSVFYGPAIWSFYSDAGNWAYALETVDSAGVARHLARSTVGANNPPSMPIMLPPLPTRINVFNGDGVNRNFHYALVVNLGGTGTY